MADLIDDGPDPILHPSRGALVAREFFTSSAHIPMVLSLGMLLAGPPGMRLLVLPALAGGFIQAWIIGSRCHRGRPPSFLANFIGVALFTVGQAVLDWRRVPGDPAILIYWAGSLVLGSCQWLGSRVAPLLAESLLVAEHTARALVIVAVYATLDGVSSGDFLGEPAHRYLFASAILLGGLLGMSAVVHRRDGFRLAEVAQRLRSYGEMLLGRSRLTRAIVRTEALEPRRTRRTVLFADIRGFTHWSEPRRPEEVLAMLGAFYEAVETACAPFKPDKVKHTADEVMMFFTDPVTAASAALAMRDAAADILAPHGLNVGAGMHHGDVIEGLVGSQKTKAYDILGDTVNTAKRVCDHAAAGKIMVTFGMYDACRGRIRVGADNPIMAKGKSSAVVVAELIAVEEASSLPA